MLRVMTWVVLLVTIIATQTMVAAQSTLRPAERRVASNAGGSGRSAADACRADEKCRAVVAMAVREFGPSFQIDKTCPVLTADLDGDGTEDAIVVATGKEVLVGQTEFRYKVIDPSNAYFGYGDPKVTTQFTAMDGPQPMLLVVHNWRAPTPRAKFVVINLSFAKISITRQLIKKKIVTAIVTEDVMGMTSSVYWAGKQYKWEPGAVE